MTALTEGSPTGGPAQPPERVAARPASRRHGAATRRRTAASAAALTAARPVASCLPTTAARPEHLVPRHAIGRLSAGGCLPVRVLLRQPPGVQEVQGALIQMAQGAQGDVEAGAA